MDDLYIKTLNIVNKCIHKNSEVDITSEDFVASLDELKAHCIIPLTSHVIAGLTLDNELKIQLMQTYSNNIRYFKAILDEQNKLGSILTDAGIPYAILKGSAAAMYYPNPVYRSMGDIDLLINPSSFDKACEVLFANGYKKLSDFDGENRHIELVGDGNIEIELHIRFSSSNDVKHNKLLDEYIYDGLSKVEVNSLNGSNFNTLPTVENGLVLLSHINHHLSSGLGLRQIIDWLCYVENCLTDELWDKTFAEITLKLGLKKLAMVTTAMCKKYLGLNGISWCDSSKDDPMVDELTEYIMNHGNFGRKINSDSKSVSVLRRFLNPIKGIKEAQFFGEKNWALLKKCPWLKPFAWLYQIIRWISHGVKNGVKVKDIKGLSDKEKAEREFLQRLEITNL